MFYKKPVPFEALLGKTIQRIDNKDDEELIFECVGGEIYKLYHNQDCCEGVRIEDICGDLDDLLSSPILLAEEVYSGEDGPEGWEKDKWCDSWTWTFYKLSTNRGSVTIRWFGESNGYYSESVELVKL